MGALWLSWDLGQLYSQATWRGKDGRRSHMRKGLATVVQTNQGAEGGDKMDNPGRHSTKWFNKRYQKVSKQFQNSKTSWLGRCKGWVPGVGGSAICPEVLPGGRRHQLPARCSESTETPGGLAMAAASPAGQAQCSESGSLPVLLHTDRPRLLRGQVLGNS